MGNLAGSRPKKVAAQCVAQNLPSPAVPFGVTMRYEVDHEVSRVWRFFSIFRGERVSAHVTTGPRAAKTNRNPGHAKNSRRFVSYG